MHKRNLDNFNPEGLVASGGDIFAQCGSATWTVAPAVQAQPLDSAEGATSEDTAEIFVTVQRRQERSRDLPISITTLSADRLAAAGVGELSDVWRVSRGIRFDKVMNFVQPTVRGIGTAVDVSGGGSNVGIYVDGFYDRIQ